MTKIYKTFRVLTNKKKRNLSVRLHPLYYPVKWFILLRHFYYFIAFLYYFELSASLEKISILVLFKGIVIWILRDANNKMDTQRYHVSQVQGVPIQLNNLHDERTYLYYLWYAKHNFFHLMSLICICFWSYLRFNFYYWCMNVSALLYVRWFFSIKLNVIKCIDAIDSLCLHTTMGKSLFCKTRTKFFSSSKDKRIERYVGGVLLPRLIFFFLFTLIRR